MRASSRPNWRQRLFVTNVNIRMGTEGRIMLNTRAMAVFSLLVICRNVSKSHFDAVYNRITNLCFAS